MFKYIHCIFYIINPMTPTTLHHIKRGANQSPVGMQGLCVRRCVMVGTQRVA